MDGTEQLYVKDLFKVPTC